MVKRGLLKCANNGGFACITPFGLRVLADEMEAGRVDDAIERIRKDVERRKAR
jgi:F0F1-type ATP synthase epsilon subunit